MVLENEYHRAASYIRRLLLKNITDVLSKKHFYGAYFLPVIGILAHNGVLCCIFKGLMIWAQMKMPRTTPTLVNL